MNRGSKASLARPPSSQPGFNEAPIHESGKLCQSGERCRTVAPRFNEAPIHESGKSRACRSNCSRLRCFNEAPIHESGKSRGASARSPAVRCFNEAPIHESGKFHWRDTKGNKGQLLQ